jgi:hypothetical protein
VSNFEEMEMKTNIVVTTIREDGTPFGTEIEVGELAQSHVLRKFNPTDNAKVDLTKVLCAAIIQQMINLRDVDQNASAAQKRAASIAITQCEALQMQAVKANFVQA